MLICVDLDGTLLDTVPANAASYRAALEELGFTVTDEYYAERLTHVEHAHRARRFQVGHKTFQLPRHVVGHVIPVHTPEPRRRCGARA